MKAYFEGDKDVFVFKPIPKTKKGRPKKDDFAQGGHMTWEECVKRLEWMAEACKRPGGVVIGGDDAAALEMAVGVMREEGAI